MHLGHPVAQAVQHQLQHARLAQVQRIAAAAVVVISRTLIGWQAVAAGIVQAAPAQGGAVFITLGGVVEHHIQQHLDARAVQGLHHAAELIARVRRVCRQVRRGAKKAQRVVAPVVAQAHRHQALLVQCLVHRQQADGGDAQLLQVGHAGRVAQAGIAAAQGQRHGAVEPAEAFDMQLIQHGTGQRGAQWLVTGPIETVVQHPGLERRAGVVTRVGLQRVRAVMAKVLRPPVKLTHDLARVRV